MSLREDLATISAKVRHTTPEIRMLKIGEEYGEAVAAMIGLGGWNPHKGQHGTSDDVATELADTALSALIALEDYCIDPIQKVTRRAAAVAVRAPSSPDGAPPDAFAATLREADDDLKAGRVKRLSELADGAPPGRCPSCGGDAADNYFDRSVCACGVMHTCCRGCGSPLDGCPYDTEPSGATPVVDGLGAPEETQP